MAGMMGAARRHTVGNLAERVRVNGGGVDRVAAEAERRCSGPGPSRGGAALLPVRAHRRDGHSSHKAQLPNTPMLYELVSDSVRERQRKGDLAGAWDDLMVLFRLARHEMGPAPWTLANWGLQHEHAGLGMAMRWAFDPRQTPELLRAAGEQYRALRQQWPYPEVELVRAQAKIFEQTLDLPRSELEQRFRTLLYTGQHNYGYPSRWELEPVLATTPWEIARARCASRLLHLVRLEQAQSIPWTEAGTVDRTRWSAYVVLSAPDIAPQNRLVFSGAELEQIEDSTPLVRYLMLPGDWLFNQRDRNEVARRALVLILALRSWQLRARRPFPRDLEGVGSVGARCASDRSLFHAPRPALRLHPIGGPVPLAAGRVRPAAVPEGGKESAADGGMAALQLRARLPRRSRDEQRPPGPGRGRYRLPPVGPAIRGVRVCPRSDDPVFLVLAPKGRK